MSNTVYRSGTFFFRAWALFAVCTFFSTSCSKDPSEIIEARVAERVNDFRQKELEKCRIALLEEANQTADSLMLKEAQAELNDSLLNRRPGKPYKPAPIDPIDSSAVRPIFDDNGGR
jgi:hypothetical protein